MKKLLFAFLLLLPLLAAAQTTPSSDAAAIAFKEIEYNFGEIEQGAIVEKVFEFENTGKSPLILSNVATSCGCTAPDWVRTPIAAGEKSKITVKFNSAGKMGAQNKVITVHSNASNAQVQLTLKGNVKEKAGK